MDPLPEEVARMLMAYGVRRTPYGVREASVADKIIDMTDRDLILVEAEATLAQVHGFRLIPYLAPLRR